MRRADPSRRLPRHAGVTLIELIVVIVISGILAAVLGAIIVRPIEGYRAQVRRAALVDAAEMALTRTARDIRQALPNSVRIRDSLGNTNNVTCAAAGVTCAIEMLNTVDGARYREGPGQLSGGHNHANSCFRLKLNGTDGDGFNIVGFFKNITVPFDSTGTSYRLAVYNQGVTGADAYADANAPANTPVVMTNPAVTTFKIDRDNVDPEAWCSGSASGGGDEDRVRPASGNFDFRWPSPNQRVFIVDKPVSYVCSAGPGGNITRYEGYAISQTQPTAAASFSGGSSALLTTPVTNCVFTYTPGTNQRAGLVTLDITLTDTASGEQVRLLHQVHVDNVP
jgi:MSHA biogenesis protein MshO